MGVAMRRGTIQTWVEEWKDATDYRLANEAECAGPDSPDSAGAKFLQSVVLSLVDAVEYTYAEAPDDFRAEDCNDIVSETADGAPDVYTATLWAEFVDLAAYREDPTDLGADGSDMEQSARVCLYIIAERLANVLIEDLGERLASVEA